MRIVRKKRQSYHHSHSVSRSEKMMAMRRMRRRASRKLSGEDNKKTAAKKLHSRYFFVPRAGIEPAHPKVQDFESSASTSSATEAFVFFAVRLTAPLTDVSGHKNKSLFQCGKKLCQKSSYLINLTVLFPADVFNSNQ